MAQHVARADRFSAPARLIQRGLVAGLVSVVLLGLFPLSVSAAGFAAEASISPDIQYLNDSTGTLYTVNVRNTGTRRSIGAVQVRRPSAAWKIVGCPDAPAGWTKSSTFRRCRYFSAPGSGDNIQPGQTRTFTLRAQTLPGDSDVSGSWRVRVSRANDFGDATDVRLAGSMAPGLTTKIYSFQILSAVVASAPATPGSVCPAADQSAPAGTSGHTIVICGRNRTTATRTPKADQAVLEGTFVASHGSFTSGPVAPTVSSRVLGNWNNVTITSVPGAGKTVVAKAGSSSLRTSPRTTLEGYTAGSPPQPPANAEPTDIALSNSSVAENEPVGTAVGTLSATDPDVGDTHTFTLVAGAGDTDNASFQIDGTALETNAVFDFETKSSYSIRIRVTDSGSATYEEQFTITVTDVAENAPPTDIQLSNSTVAENQPSGTTVGTLTTTDPDVGDTHTYSLVAGTGDSDNAKFQISGSTLQTAQSLDFEADSSLSVRIRTSDGGNAYEEAFAITVTNANEAPTDIALSNSSVAEEQPVGTTVGTLSATDPDAGDTHTFTLVAGAGDTDNASFQIDGSTLKTNAVFDFETKNSYSIRVRATDGPGLTLEEQFTITITDVNLPPTDIQLSNSTVAENQPSGTTVGTLTTTDPDAGDTHTYTLVAGAGDDDNAKFQISGSTLHTAQALDFEADSSLSVRIRTSDASSNFEESFTITVTNANDAPSDIALSNSTVAENQPSGTTVGILSATDQDAGATHTFTLVAGAGDADNAKFQISGTTLQTAQALDFEADSSLNVRVRADDGAGGTFEKQLIITVTNTNDAPTDIALSNSSVAENEPVGTAVGTLSASDQDAGDTHTFALVAGAGDTDNASFQIDGSTLETNAVFDFETKSSYSIRVRATDGGSATFEKQLTITITNANEHAPTDINLSNSSIAEGQPAGTAVGTLSTVDGDAGDTHTYTLVAGTGSTDNTSFQIDGDTLESAAVFDFETKSSYSIRIRTTDSGALTFEEQFTITVTNDIQPTAVDDSATVGEDSGASAIDVLANDTDPDGGPKTISSASDPANGAVVLTGGSLGAHTGLTYQPDPNFCNDPPGTTLDTFTYTVNGGSTATVSVTVTCVDDQPTAVNDSATVAEDAGATAISVLSNDTDVDGGPITIASASDPANGTVVLTGGSPGLHTGLTYQPDPNYCNNPPGTTPDTFTYTINGGSTATVSVTVNCAPDNPVVDTSAGSTSYTENAAATAIDAALTVTDPDAGTTITGATAEITGNYAGAEDILALAGSHPGITPSFVGDTLTLTGSASTAAYQSALRDVTYSNTSQNPSTLTRTVTFTVTDDTAGSGSDTKDITVSAVDDPPTAVNDSATVLEDAAATSITVLTNDTDVDAGPKTISSASDPANGTVVLTGGSPGAHSGLTYQPDPNYCNDPPGTTPDTFTYTLNGGSTATVSMTVTCVNDAPVADDETFNGASSAIGNTTLAVNDPDDGAPTTPDPTDTSPATNRPNKTIAGDILAGDTDIDGPGPLVISAGTFATNDGGTVTLQADGDFTFEPAASTSCTDTTDFFDYTVSDLNGAGPGPTPGTDTGRVTIAITGCVWYVNNDDAQGNSGTSEKPFDTLAQAETASSAGHSIFVYDGNDTTTGYAAGINLKANQKLVGEAATLTVGSDTLHTADAANKPTITDNNADVVDLDDGNEVRGFNIDPQGTGGGIAGSTGDTSGGTIDDVNIVDTGTAGTQAGLELNGTTGTFNVSNLVVNNGATGVLLNNAGTVAFAPSGTISITSAGAAGLVATGTGLGTSTFDSITVTGSGNGGVNLTTVTGTTTFGDLSLTTTSGTTPAFGLSNAGTVSVPAAGTANVSATGGPAVDVTGTSGATLEFDNVSSTNSASDGINLAGLGVGTFSATSGAIGGAAVIAFDLDSGSGAISYPGAINNGAGESAEITNRTGGTVTLSGAIADTSDAAGGIALTGNTGATMTFSGGMTLSTGASGALAATGGGTLNVTGTNTLTTTTGTALNVANTTIGASGVTFQSIAANGGVNGIVLNNTGSTAGLTVTGTGSAGTGGVIQNSSGPGILLTSTQSPSFSWMTVQAGGDDGIRGSGVVNFTLANSTVFNNGNAVNESGVDFVGGLTGTASISSTTVDTYAENGMIVTNASGSLNLTVTGSSFINASAATGNDGIHLDANDTAAITASVTGSTFNNNRGDHFQFSTNASSSGTNSVTYSSNTLTGDRGAPFGDDLGAGITISTGGSSDTTFTVASNNIQGAVFPTIGIDVGTSSTAGFTLSGTVDNNTIGNAAVAASGGAQSSSIALVGQGAGTLTVAVTNNTIRQNDGFAAIDILSRDGSPTINATVTGNNVANPATGGGNGLLLRNGAITTDGGFTCATISGNSLAGSAVAGLDDFRLRQRFNTTVRLPGYAGTAGDTAAVVAFVQGNNTGAETGSATVDFPATGGGFVGGAACPTP